MQIRCINVHISLEMNFLKNDSLHFQMYSSFDRILYNNSNHYTYEIVSVDNIILYVDSTTEVQMYL